MTESANSTSEAKTTEPEKTTPAPVVTKTKVIRVNLSGADFLDFHSIAGRVVFADKTNERSTDEELVKIAIRRFAKEIAARIKKGEQFISADSL